MFIFSTGRSIMKDDGFCYITLTAKKNRYGLCFVHGVISDIFYYIVTKITETANLIFVSIK